MPVPNPLVAELSPPPIPSVQGWARAYSGGHGPLIDLSQAVPGYPPHKDLLRWLGEAAASKAYAGYGDIEGEPALRTAYALNVSELYGADIAARNVHITSGCNQAFVAAVMAVAAAGDAIVVTNPWYFNHETTLRMLGIEARTVDCLPERSFLPDPKTIEKALGPKVRAVALVSPNNPTGAVYPPALLNAIFEICHRNGVWLILDETYRDFLALGTERPHRLFSAPAWNEALIQLYSFSKSFCIPGHRLGAVVADQPVVVQIGKIMDNLQICASRAPQAAVAKGLSALVEWRRANRTEIAARAEALVETLGEMAWQVEAIGAYFAFVRHPFEGVSSVRVAEELAKRAGIVTIPGEFFGPGQERYLRFAFANATVATVSMLRERLQGFTLA
ncbi:aminotransferase [Nitratireductor sp. GCM10026969]|uniref:aminotransferase n=1 Tax=Nitratireductor sp. GCM10026969 TaxID=3252645 RepID=UPI00361E8CA6